MNHIWFDLSFGYGDVVDVIRGSIVDSTVPAQSWTSGMVTAISASLSEAASQLLPTRHENPRREITHRGGFRRGRGRAGSHCLFSIYVILAYI